MIPTLPLLLMIQRRYISGATKTHQATAQAGRAVNAFPWRLGSVRPKTSRMEMASFLKMAPAACSNLSQLLSKVKAVQASLGI
jgi:hypothetical protein